MYIALYDENSGDIRFPIATQKGKRTKYPTRKADMKKRGKTEEIIFTRKPILHKTKKEAEKWYEQPGHEEKVGLIQPSWLGVPMMAGEKVLGVLAIYDLEQEYVYDEQDLQVFSSMASQAAIAILNSRLYSEARGEANAAKQLATLGTATAALQHRINNTFNIIVPNVTRLRKRVNTKDETIAEILDIIERNARYTSDIIGRLQEALRGGDKQYVNINSLLKEVSDVAKANLRKRPKIRLLLKLDESIPEMELSSGQVAEVFRNTIENSIRAMKRGGIIKVTSALDNGKINVRIIDQGSGIPESMLARLFSMPVPSKDLTGGSGLGLWLCSLMLQSVGGAIKVENTSRKGTTMLIEIPIFTENNKEAS